MKTITELLEKQKLTKEKHLAIIAENERVHNEKMEDSTLQLYEFIRSMIEELTTNYLNGNYSPHVTSLVKELKCNDYYQVFHLPEELNNILVNEEFKLINKPESLSDFGWEWSNEYIRIRIFRENISSKIAVYIKS